MTSAKDYATIFGSNFYAARLRAGFKIADLSERTGTREMQGTAPASV